MPFVDVTEFWDWDDKESRYKLEGNPTFAQDVGRLLTAKGLDPAQMVAQELHELAPMSLYSYHARAFPPGLQATRMLGMLPALLHEALQPNPKARQVLMAR